MLDDWMTRLQLFGARRPLHRWSTAAVAVAGAGLLLGLLNSPTGEIGWVMSVALAVVVANGWLAYAMAPGGAWALRRGLMAWLGLVLLILTGMASARDGGEVPMVVATVLFVATVLLAVVPALRSRARACGMRMRDCSLRLAAVLLAFVLWYLAAAVGASGASVWSNVAQALALGVIAAVVARQVLLRRAVVPAGYTAS